jgi:hypothetical protein
MLLDKLIRWVQREVPDRSGTLSTATALVVDATRQTKTPELMTFDEWRTCGLDPLTPPKAVAFLQIFSDWTIATIVDVERLTVPLRVQLPTEELGTFSAAFLRTRNATDTRSILLAPKWYMEQAKAVDAGERPHLAMMATAARGDEGGAAPAGVVAPGDKPPKGPRVQALVTLAEETAILQTLPVIAGQPLEA